MRVAQLSWSEAAGWAPMPDDRCDSALVFFFGTRQALSCGSRYDELRAMFPRAHILGCSTGGQIRNQDVTDDEITAAAIRFDATTLRVACAAAPCSDRSRICGEAIGRALAGPDLVGVFVLSDGLNINGSELVAGIIGVVGKQVAVTGGLAGDGPISARLWSAPIAGRANMRSERSASTARRSASATAAPAAGTSLGHAARSRARAAMCCSNSTAGRRLISTSAISARSRRVACRDPAYCFRCASSIRSGRTTTSSALSSPSITRRVR